MENKEDEDRPSSPYWTRLSEEAFRVAGEALNTMYPPSSGLPPPVSPRHKRSQSELVAPGHRRSNSFLKLKNSVQKAWRWGGNSRDERHRSSFNPEVLANQKRQWYQLHSKTKDKIKYKEPTSIFEHFIVAGLHPDANLEAAEEAFARRKKWELEVSKSEMVDYRMLHNRGPAPPTFEPQIIFKYPPGKKLDMRLKDLASFCFPAGIKARLLERTPSFSDLNALLYGQEHLGRDDLAFIFSLKVADNATLYGICLHVTEVVQRPPGILGGTSPLIHSSGAFYRFLVAAPRCYCLLTRVPFFELHYEMLNSIIAQERLNRITEFVSEMSLSLTDYVPSVSKRNELMHENIDSPDEEYSDWMASAIPVDSALALTAAAAGIISDDEVPSASLKICSPRSPESTAASEASDFCHAREIDKDIRKNMQCFDENVSEPLDNHSDGFERSCGSYENGHASPDIGATFCSRSQTLERIGSSQSLFSPARSIASEDDDDDDDLFSTNEFGDDSIMEWARENKNDLLQIVCGYHSLPLPSRGKVVVFQPLEHLQAIEYMRPPFSALGFDEKYYATFEAAEVNAKLAASEEALALSIWTTAAICRVLSLESVLALVAGVLLEKQIVVVCPNLGVLSAIVLSLVPMIRPFQWQSLLLPVLPVKMLDFLEAPVPFLVGLQHKPADLKLKTSDLVLVNVIKNQVKTCHLPTLPHYRELVHELGPIHARMAFEGSVAKRHPVYRCNEVQAEAANQFLTIMRHYMESLCADLRSHTITSVQSNKDRVCLLLKDSYIDSFPTRDRPFIKLLVETQLFTVLLDSRLSSFEHDH
ncbi:hypothetical protein SLA2020_155390 [Shorea laevis]